MGSFANTLFTILLGWLQGIVSAVWSAFTTENGQTLITWIGHHWLLIAGILCFAGLSADLCVYVVRWKPFRVWRGFFSRGRDPEGEPEREVQNDPPARQKLDAPARGPYYRTVPERSGREERTDDPDLSQWRSEPVKEEPVKPAVKEQPSLITGAGYSVPADSPYRRPAGQAPAPAVTTRKETRTTDTDPEENGKSGPAALRPRKRRRISVNELFSDPEEELLEFDAPQDIIDRKKAYHAPVYPRGWKKGGEDEQ